MNTPEAIRLADDVAGMAEHLKQELLNGYPRKEVFHDIYALRRSVERLEVEVRDVGGVTLSDAC